MTAMPVLSDESTVLMLVEDAADDVTCDWAGCDVAAAWSLRCEGCSHVILACGPHRAHDDAILADGRHEAACRKCDRIHPLPLAWLPL